MPEHARNLPPPLPEKRKPKLIEGAGEDLEEISSDELIELDGAEPIVEVDVDLSDLDESAPDAGAERHEKLRRERQPLFDALAARGLKPEAALEVIAAFDPERMKDKELTSELESVAASYGVRFGAMSDAAKEKMMVMYLGARDGRVDASKADVAEALEAGIRDQLVGQAFTDIEGLKHEKITTPEQLKSNLREVMATLHALSKQLSFEKKENEATWTKLYDQFKQVREAKKGSSKLGPEIETAFKEIFDEFSDFIEDELVMYRIHKQPGSSLEDQMREVYGRSKEEVEALKQENRAAVVEAIRRMQEKHGIDISMLEELHAVNNRGIVPKKQSKLRDDPDKISFFGKAGRLGLLGPDVKPMMEEMLGRANDLVDKRAVGEVSGLQYQIEVAKLHNDMLDMHPFGDRNGSTSLLFIELMMTREGYEPPKERQKDYYYHLSTALGYNPVAVAIVGHEQYKISYEQGYYGEDKMPPEKKQRYDKVIELVNKIKQRKG